MVLLPTDNNKLLMQLKGPYVIKEKINRFDYRIDVNGKERVYHANLLRMYIERGKESCDNALDAAITAGLAEFAEQVCVSVIEETDLYEVEHSETWESHVNTLRALLLKLREASLTAKPSKCKLGYIHLPFLGHRVGRGMLSPDPGKVASIKECSAPTTKKQVRSFLGLVGYYRKFIPNFNTIASVLTDMTKKGAPCKVVWSPSADLAFKSLISALCKRPILRLPDFDRDFILRTDASEFGLGAVCCKNMRE